MEKIYTGIDLGSDSIKIVVCEKINDKFHVLASTSSKSHGIVNGQIEDTKAAVQSVKVALKEIDEMLGIKITKVIVAIPPTNCQMNIVQGKTNVIDYNDITGTDVSNAIMNALKNEQFINDELVTAMPISFSVDKQENIKDPKKMKGSKLSTKVVISTTEKEPLYRILEVLKLSGVEAIDISFTSTADYFTIKNKKYDELVGAIIDIGKNNTNIAVYNKGIQIKNSSIPIGSKNVDKDLSYIFKIDLKQAKKIKEEFAVASSNYADNNDILEITTSENEQKEITQLGVSKVVEARIKEILKLSKNEIKNLTNREIRYIIITGGLSEISGFQNIVDDEFGFVAKVCNITTMGIRHNKYSSALGVIKYFDDKLSLRGKTYNMFEKEDIINLTSIEQKITANENIIGKVFKHFFDN